MCIFRPRPVHCGPAQVVEAGRLRPARCRGFLCRARDLRARAQHPTSDAWQRAAEGSGVEIPLPLKPDVLSFQRQSPMNLSQLNLIVSSPGKPPVERCWTNQTVSLLTQRHALLLLIRIESSSCLCFVLSRNGQPWSSRAGIELQTTDFIKLQEPGRCSARSRSQP